MKILEKNLIGINNSENLVYFLNSKQINFVVFLLCFFYRFFLIFFAENWQYPSPNLRGDKKDFFYLKKTILKFFFNVKKVLKCLKKTVKKCFKKGNKNC